MLTIAQLAERTGVSAGTLRMWESRHGFPLPERGAGGHRRYRERDADLIAEVRRLRDGGLSLAAAIERVRAREETAPVSIYAALRERRPELAPTVISKQALLALTRAAEDEWSARGAGGILVGSFQRERFYRQAEPRWSGLARTASIAIALADFESLREPAEAAAEVPVPRDHAIGREWTLVALAPHTAACLAAWEPPATAAGPDSARRFELVWSAEPEVARAAAAIAADVVSTVAPALAERLRARLPEPAPPAPLEVRAIGALAHRMIGYLAAEPRP